jgi:hypothetical protein
MIQENLLKKSVKQAIEEWWTETAAANYGDPRFFHKYISMIPLKRIASTPEVTIGILGHWVLGFMVMH